MNPGARVLVTGATGQDGSYLLERLLERHASVTAVTRPGDELSAGLPAVVHRRTAALDDAEELRRIFRDAAPQYIFHLGAVSSVAASWERPAETMAVNTVSTAALLEAMASAEGARLVLASSSEIFGHASDSPQTEATAIRPATPYGVSKAAAHQLVSLWRGRGSFASTAILYNHESPRRPETFVTRKITAGAARIARGLQDHLTLGALDARRDWGWAPDYVDAILAIADAEEPDDFIVASGRSHTVAEFADAALRAAGVTSTDGLIVSDPRFVRPADVAEMVGDASRIRSRLGWRPTVDFPALVQRMVAHDLALIDQADPAR